MFDQLMRQDAAPVRQVQRRTIGPNRYLGKGEHWRPTPWGLTSGQIESLSAVIEHGSVQTAAEKINLSPQTVKEQCWRAKKRMGLDTLIQAALEYDRFVRGQQ